MLRDGTSSLDDPPCDQILEHCPSNSFVVDPLMFKKFCILCSDKGLNQRFGNPFVRDRDTIVHQKLPHQRILLRVDDGVCIEVSLLQRLKVRKTVGVVKKEKNPDEEGHNGGDDEGVYNVKS